MLAGENIGSRFVLPTVAGCVDLVVHLGIGHDGQRRVREIVAVSGRIEEQAIETESLFSTSTGSCAGPKGSCRILSGSSQAGYSPSGLLTELPRGVG